MDGARAVQLLSRSHAAGAAVLGPPAPAGEFRQGWPVLLAAMVGNGLGFVALPFYTIGALAPHLADEFGWKFAEIMAGVPIVSVVVLTLSPFVGRLSDRIGVRRVALTSLLLYGVSFMLFAVNRGSLWTYYANWVLLGVAGSGTLPLCWTRAVNNWFDANKGIALGITMMGTGLFGTLAKLTVAAVLLRWDWQMCYIVIGLAPILIAFPIGLLGFHDRAARPAADGGAQADVEGWDYRRILRSWRFWLIGIAFMLLSFALGGPMPHLENILFDKGFPRTDAASIVAAFGLAVIVGRVAGGFLIDRFWAPFIAVVLFLLPALGLGLFIAGGQSTALAYVMIVLFGLGTGIEYDLMSFLIARYFGMRNYGSAYGTLYLMFGVGAGAGPVLFGWAYDIQGHYATILQVSIALLVIPSIMLLTLGRYTYPITHRQGHHA